jgi:hypothetical protein
MSELADWYMALFVLHSKIETNQTVKFPRMYQRLFKHLSK